jgi:hypothetical protein
MKLLRTRLAGRVARNGAIRNGYKIRARKLAESTNDALTWVEGHADATCYEL